MARITKYEKSKTAKYPVVMKNENREMKSEEMILWRIIKFLLSVINYYTSGSAKKNENKFQYFIEGGYTQDAKKPSLKEFKLRFSETHGDFINKLIRMYPNLSTAEIKVISLIRINLNTKEIAEITDRSISTIENTRNSIRKKMKLLPSESLVAKILTIS